MADTTIEPGQVWRYRDEREDRSVVVDSVDVAFAQVRNEVTGRRSRQRLSTLLRYYRLVR